MMRECLFKSGNLTNLTSTITKCQMLWPELIFSDPPISHLGDFFLQLLLPPRICPSHIWETFLQLFLATLVALHFTPVSEWVSK